MTTFFNIFKVKTIVVDYGFKLKIKTIVIIYDFEQWFGLGIIFKNVLDWMFWNNTFCFLDDLCTNIFVWTSRNLLVPSFVFFSQRKK